MLVGTLRNEQRTLWTIFHSSRSLCGQKQPLGNTTLPPTHPTELSLSLHGIFNPFDCPVRQTGACLKCQVRGGKKGRRFANMTVVHQHGQSARVHQHASTKGLDATPPSLPPLLPLLLLCGSEVTEKVIRVGTRVGQAQEQSAAAFHGQILTEGYAGCEQLCCSCWTPPSEV